MLPNTSRAALIPIIKAKIMLDSVVYTDTYMTYDNLDVSGFRHHRINHRQGFAANANHINGIENFWNQAKRHLRKYNGIPNATSISSSRNASGASTTDLLPSSSLHSRHGSDGQAITNA